MGTELVLLWSYLRIFSHIMVGLHSLSCSSRRKYQWSIYGCRTNALVRLVTAYQFLNYYDRIMCIFFKAFFFHPPHDDILIWCIFKRELRYLSASPATHGCLSSNLLHLFCYIEKNIFILSLFFILGWRQMSGGEFNFLSPHVVVPVPSIHISS